MTEQRVNEYLAAIGPEREHELREMLQAMLGRHWLSVYYPEKTEIVLEKMRNPEGKVA